MGAKSKRAKRDRQKGEFDLTRIAAMLRPPKDYGAACGWSLERILAARDAQRRGQFAQAAEMAEAMQCDDALYVAKQNRLAPLRGLPILLKAPNESAAAKRVLTEADALFGPKGFAIGPDGVADINDALADHGIAVAANAWTPRDDGSRVDVEVHPWPMKHVRWDDGKRCLMTRIDGGTGSIGDRDPAFARWASYGEVPIVHGDGRWIVFQKRELAPWAKDAALLAAPLVWARHAYAARDWSRGATTHGNAKLVGTLPAEVAIDSAEGAAFLELLTILASVENPVGIKPFGSTAEILANPSAAWQVFKELVGNGETAAARIYLGQDGLLGSNSNAPGIDLRGLFGVRNDIVEGDAGAIERGLFTGTIQIWTAINHGDSSLAPERKFQLPDSDEDARTEGLSKRRKSFFDSLQGIKAMGAELDQDTIDEQAKAYNVATVKLPPVTEDKVPTIQLAPTDVAKVVLVNEARASAGLGPLLLATGAEDPDGKLTVSAFDAKQAARAAAPTAPPSPAVAVP
jgi:hypothetical protein